MIVQDGLRRMVEEQEDVYYYITLMNENYPHPGLPEGAREGILKGMYKLSDGGAQAQEGPRVQLLGSGTILREVMAARRAAQEGLGRGRRRVELPELQRAAPRRHRRRALEPAASGREAARLLRRAVPRAPRRGR